MNWQRLLIAFVAVYVLAAVLNFLIHSLFLMSTYEALSSIWRPDMDRLIWIQWVTGIFFSFFFVYIFVRGYEGKGVLEGVRFGLIIWGFASIPMIYGQYMVYPLPYSLVLKWLFTDLLVLIILGITVALIYKPQQESSRKF
jgi:hypothetical protein